MRARRVFYEGLASLLDAGIPVRAAMAQLSARAGGSYGEALRHLHGAVEAGRPLADAMEERPRAFRRFEIELVRAGEVSGTLERACRSVAADEEASDRVRRKAFATLVYPAFVFHFAGVPLNIIDPPRAGFLAGLLLWILPFWVAVGLGWWLLRRARTGGPAGTLLLAVPVLGGILRDLALLRWARTYCALDDAGIGPEPCALRAAGATGLASLEAGLAAPAARLRAGASRTEAFADAPLPPEMYAALGQGETAGSIGPLLRKAADAHEMRLTTRTDSVMAMLPAVATILAGGVVLYAALKVFGRAYSIR